MIKMGIIDPAKLLEQLLQAAGSVAGLMITTEAMIADVRPEWNSMLAVCLEECLLEWTWAAWAA